MGWVRATRTGHVNQPGELLTARGGSLCFLQHVALCVKLIAAWYIPDVPQSVKNQFLDRKHSNLRKELRWVMPPKVPGAAVLRRHSLQQETCLAAGSIHSRAPRPG